MRRKHRLKTLSLHQSTPSEPRHLQTDQPDVLDMPFMEIPIYFKSVTKKKKNSGKGESLSQGLKTVRMKIETYIPALYTVNDAENKTAMLPPEAKKKFHQELFKLFYELVGLAKGEFERSGLADAGMNQAIKEVRVDFCWFFLKRFFAFLIGLGVIGRSTRGPWASRVRSGPPYTLLASQNH